MGSPGLLGASVLLVLAHVVAYALAYLYLRWRRHARILRTGLLVPLAILVAYSIPEALSTLRGTWNNPTNEADAGIRLFLTWAGWKGLCLYLMLWIVGWALALDALESLRSQGGRRRAVIFGFAQLFLLYALAMGNLDGYSSWTEHPSFFYHASADLVLALWQHIPAAHAMVQLTYVMYPPLMFAMVCTLAHGGVVALGRRTQLALLARERPTPKLHLSR